MKFSFSNKSWVLLSTTIIIIIAFSVYFLVFVKGKEEAIVSNNFRVLNQIVLNIKSLEASYSKNARISSASLKDKESVDKAAYLNQNLRLIIDESEYAQVSKKRNGRPLFYGDNGICFFQKKTHRRKDTTLAYITDYDVFFNNPLLHRKDVFDQIIIIKDASGTDLQKISKQILYSNGTLGIMDSVFYYTPMKVARGEITINDTKYYTFNQIVGENPDVFISGLVLKSNFDQQKRSVAPFTISFLSIILILIILAIPLLKLRIMNLEERLHIKDVVFSVISLLVGPAVLIIFLYTFIAFVSGEMVPDKIKANLKLLSENIESNFSNELEDIIIQGNMLDATFHINGSCESNDIKESYDLKKLGESFGDTVYFDPENYEKKQFFVYKNVLENTGIISKYKHMKSAFWADSEGNSRIVLSAYKSPSYGQNLSHRKYLMNVVNNRRDDFISHDGNHHEVVIESIKSVNDGSYEVGIGIPTKCQNGLLPVFATSSKMSSVVDVVLEEGYGFCILDKEGNIMFHDDKYKNLNENFIEETGGAFEYALLSNTTQLKTLDYNGKKQVILFRPLNCLPDKYIATFVNTQVFYGPFTLSMISAFLFFISYLFILLIVYLLTFIAFYRPTKLKQMVYLFSFLKPFETKKHLIKYKKLVWHMALVLLYLLVTIFLNNTNYDFVIGEILIISIIILVSAYIFLGRILPKEEIIFTYFRSSSDKAVKIIGILICAFLFARVISFFGPNSNWPVIVNAVIGAGVMMFFIYQLLLNEQDTDEISETLTDIQEVKSLQKTFRRYLFLMVIIYSIIPINLFLAISFNKEDEILSKYRGLVLINGTSNWYDIKENEFQNKLTNNSENIFGTSLGKDETFQYLLDQQFEKKRSSLDTLGKVFEDDYENGRIVWTSDTASDRFLTENPSNKFFNTIYDIIRPDYNARSESTGNYISNSSSNPLWLFYCNEKQNIISKINYKPDKGEDDRNVLIEQVKIDKSSFYSNFWMPIVFILFISLITLYSFIKFILNKMYGFKYKNYALKVMNFKSEDFHSTFLGDDVFSNNSSYNNLFVVGVNLAHKTFIRDYITNNEGKTLFVLNMDDFFEQANDKPEKPISFKDIIKVNQYSKDGSVEEKGWSEIEAYYQNPRNPAYILIEHFEFGYNDARVNKLKIQLLKYLVDCEKFKVIIKSEINATKLLDFYDDSIKRIEKLLEDKSISDRLTLMDIVSDLKGDYKKWQHLLGSFVKCIIPLNILSDDQELKHGEFLNMLQKYINGVSGPNLDADDHILAIQQMSYPYYFSVWNSLSKAERYIVFDIAKDRFVNTVNTNDIVSLLNKGILVYDHSLRLMNESFTNFVLTKVSSDEALEMEMASRKKGTWNTAFGVIILLVISLVIFLSIGQQNFLNDINAFLTSIAALVGLLIRFSGFLTFGSSKVS